MLTSFWRATAF